MAKRKQTETPEEKVIAPIIDQPITDTVEKNFMPYAMSVIVSRAIPGIDGFKPAHRKLLYTMYTMGLLKDARTKSANVVGATMKLNPHGDMAIYATLARLTKAQESLLHPFIDSKGAFGKHYSSEMKCAAPRYTECKLDKFCEEIFAGIDKNAVDMVENYDGTMLEPTILPTAFPNILVSPNLGVAVSMACNFCSFNLNEICDGTIKLLKNPGADDERLMEIITAPDFPTGGEILYDRDTYAEVFRTGRGSIKVRAKYRFDKSSNTLDIYEIPYSTDIEAIIDKICKLTKEGKIKEISDVRDEIDLHGFRLSIDLRRGTDPDKLMQKLYRYTTLEDSFDCNFNLLIDGAPRQMGIREILTEWIKFRRECLKRELTFELGKKKEKLNLLTGLGLILLDIDKAIKIIRETKLEKEVIPNLMAGFGLNKEQAEYVAEIKLRNINKEYIINRIKELESLKNEIAELEKIIGSEVRLNNEIINQLNEIKKKYGKERKSTVVGADTVEVYDESDNTEDYKVKLVYTAEGYFKKITTQSFRGNDEQKLKEGDKVVMLLDASNRDELMFFSDGGQIYNAKVDDFDCVKASQLGDYIPAKLKFDGDNEKSLCMLVGNSQTPGKVVVFFENGKAVKLPLSAYETKSNRRKITGAYSTVSKPVGVVIETDKPKDVFISSDESGMLLSTALVTEKSTRTAQGATVMNFKKKNGKIIFVTEVPDLYGVNSKRCRKNKVPSTGITLEENDVKIITGGI